MTAEGEGDILLNLQLDNETNQGLLKKVLFVPEMGSSGLVSVRCMVPNGPTGQVLRTGPVGRLAFMATTRLA